MPAFAATPVPTINAVGVASPSAQGQAITITETAAMMPEPKSPMSSHQARKLAKAMASTIGTKTAATRSTRRCTGAFFACAASTSLMIRASIDCSPTARVSMRKRPLPLIEPPVTLSPATFATGRLSPVRRLSSTSLSPESTMPSAGKPLARPHHDDVGDGKTGDRHLDLTARALDSARVRAAATSGREAPRSSNAWRAPRAICRA